MAFFQQTVLDKYLRTLNREQLQTAYEQFTKTFLNPVIQENIRQSKEEQYQAGFLRDLFVRVLGYTLNPDENFNLTTEYKNIKDAKKADGAILINGKVKAVIELKGTNTTDLDKIEDQAFGYKNNQPDCTYIIISNFEKLRFYIDNAIEYHEFNLFTLTRSEFDLLWLCLAHENIATDLPKRIKTASISQEDEITKKLYKDYSQFKHELFRNIVKLNPQHDELELFKKSQKLLDRFLFIFFAEDRSLLPPNSMRKILHQWDQLKELDAYTPLYARFKKYFHSMNTGFTGKNDDVFAYNGGLFKPDEILDSIEIDDALLYEHTLKLSHYNYASEVDVNILGHIFENSLNEIEEVKASLEGKEIDKSKTKRKKDGVYYTPKYITKYIVENTVGKLCDEKKHELGIVEDDYLTERKRNILTKKPLLDKLETYRNWLLQLTICDPACGSGAFLNQALDFLIHEHHYIDELTAKLTGAGLVFEDVEVSILENNLFGVDLNEESVEIAKLSLWLRTARPRRKLNDLNNNIKCGNSLIDDPDVAGDKAFNWQTEFPHVFANGGFDVVIGNPPYVNAINLVQNYKEERTYLDRSDKFTTLLQKWDLYIPFIEKGLKLLKANGIFSMIIPFPYINQLYAKLSRINIIKNYNLIEIVDCSNTKVFSDAVVDNCIPFIKNNIKSDSIKISSIKDNNISLNFIKSITDIVDEKNNFIWNISRQHSFQLEENKFSSLGDFCFISIGMVLNADETKAKGLFKKEDLLSKIKTDVNSKKYVSAKDIDKYIINNFQWLEWDTDRVPNLIRRPTFKELYETDKLLINKIGNVKAVYDEEFIYCDQTIRIVILWKDLKSINNNSINNSVKRFYQKERAELERNSENSNLKYLLSIINSKLGLYLLNQIRGVGNIDINPEYLKSLPIPDISNIYQQPFIEKADQMLSLNKSLQEISQKFVRALERHFEIDQLPVRLQEWHTLPYNDFLKELRKKKIRLSLAQEAEWEDYFREEKEKAAAIAQQIAATDREIDQMVYALYGLTDEEINIVEMG